MAANQQSLDLRTHVGARRTSMNSRKITRALSRAMNRTSAEIARLAVTGWRPPPVARYHDSTVTDMSSANMRASRFLVAMISPQQIEQPEDDDPEYVDQVPEGGAIFNDHL